MSNPVTANIGYLSRTVALMPVSSDKYPTMLPNLWQELLVGNARICGNVLLIDSVVNACTM